MSMCQAVPPGQQPGLRTAPVLQGAVVQSWKHRGAGGVGPCSARAGGRFPNCCMVTTVCRRALFFLLLQVLYALAGDVACLRCCHCFLEVLLHRV